jgi:hypothetical protein
VVALFQFHENIPGNAFSLRRELEHHVLFRDASVNQPSLGVSGHFLDPVGINLQPLYEFFLLPIVFHFLDALRVPILGRYGRNHVHEGEPAPLEMGKIAHRVRHDPFADRRPDETHQYVVRADAGVDDPERPVIRLQRFEYTQAVPYFDSSCIVLSFS